MSKRGYKCVKWTPEQDAFIVNNYLHLSNEEIATAINLQFGLNRTEDAVRKELNHLRLRRPKKSLLKELLPSAHNNSFFKSIRKGLEVKRKRQSEAEREVKRQEKINKERDWAARTHGIGTQDKVVKEDTRELVWIIIDGKTRMQVPKGTEAKWARKFKQQQITL